MTVFEIINKLFFQKKESFEDLDQESLQSFQPFMINRWLSFYDKTQAILVNETINKFSGILDNKNDLYKFFYFFIPHLRYKRINYIKKKKEVVAENKEVDIYAKHKNISKREVQIYLDLQNSLAK